MDESLELPNVEEMRGKSQKPGGSRERSTIEFPYGDLDDAVGVTKTIHQRGGDACTLDQLAAWMNHESVTSGTFRLKIAAARTFGLVDMERQSVQLTPLGRTIVDASKERLARVDAFLHVPLYQKVYETYRGRLLPPDSGLESMMGNMGVAKKQTSRARQSFRRSAGQAGLFELGADRLVLPSGAQPTKEITEEQQPQTPPSNRQPYDSDLHPFVKGLLAELPEPGAAWPEDKREAWLETAKSIFKLIYRAN